MGQQVALNIAGGAAARAAMGAGVPAAAAVAAHMHHAMGQQVARVQAGSQQRHALCVHRIRAMLCPQCNNR
jgi:hypothetical protein